MDKYESEARELASTFGKLVKIAGNYEHWHITKPMNGETGRFTLPTKKGEKSTYWYWRNIRSKMRRACGWFPDGKVYKSKEFIVQPRSKAPVPNTSHWIKCSSDPATAPVLPGDTTIERVEMKKSFKEMLADLAKAQITAAEIAEAAAHEAQMVIQDLAARVFERDAARTELTETKRLLDIRSAEGAKNGDITKLRQENETLKIKLAEALERNKKLETAVAALRALT